MGKKQTQSAKNAPVKGKRTKAKSDPPSKKGKKETKKSMLDEIEAISSSEEGSVDESNTSWNKQAEELKKRIAEGAFEKILSSKGGNDDDSIEEVVLGEEDSSDEGVEEDGADKEEEASEDSENSAEEEEDSESEVVPPAEDKKAKVDKKSESLMVAVDTKDLVHDKNSEGESESEEEKEDEERSDNEDDEKEENAQSQEAIFDTNSKALLAKTAELVSEKKGYPWVERFEVIPATPLPFGTVDDETGTKIDVHDDLKREVAFYDIAMEAVEEARKHCKEQNIPFTRPDDFFAEMVKSDDHMARVKDRLIFENKKIEAVAQRRSNQEQKLRSKEAHSNKIAEKSRKKKENLKAVDDWAKAAASNRGGKYSDKDDQTFLKNLSASKSKDKKRGWTDREGNLQSGPNKKRLAADKKYGFGGRQQGRFKQNNPKDINDMSGFNPKGNFGGKGSKKGPGGAGAKRQGKRARDASRSRGGR